MASRVMITVVLAIAGATAITTVAATIYHGYDRC